MAEPPTACSERTLRSPSSEFFAVNTWPRYLVQKRTAFLDYDPTFLRNTYKYENPIAGGNPYTELVNILALATLDTYPKITINASSAAFQMARWNNTGDGLVDGISEANGDRGHYAP